MRRRHFLIALTAFSQGAAIADMPKVQNLDDALRWLDRLERARRAETTGAWPLSSVLDHLAQSVEMSMDGFPQPKSMLFQNTAGSAAFTWFKWRGQMSHGLAEPIPGAPALLEGPNWRPGADRLRQAIARFQGHKGPFRRHFAYGMLGKPDYALAHSFHIANHQDEIVVA
jgi:hypothetical protein